MKDILGHASRSRGEIVEILVRGGTYTCPTLPHQRYDRVKQACRDLRQLGLVPAKSRSDLRGVTGRTPVSVNLAPTPLFREWQRAHAGGETTLGAVRWAKARRARTPEKHSDAQVRSETSPFPGGTALCQGHPTRHFDAATRTRMLFHEHSASR